MYQVEITHPGLHKHRLIRGADRWVVHSKALIQQAQWDAMWERRLQATRRSEERQRRADDRREEKEERESKKQLAEERTREAEAEIEALRNLLSHTLKVDDRIEWDSLKERPPLIPPRPLERPPVVRPSRPARNSPFYQPTINSFDWIVPGRVAKKRAEAQAWYDKAIAGWEAELASADREDARRTAEYERDVATWEAQRRDLLAAVDAKNATVDRLRDRYRAGETDAVEEYCDLVLSRSKYPDTFPCEFDIQYSSSSRVLLVEYSLPSLDCIPRVKDVRYVTNRDDFVESELDEKDIGRLYDETLYKIVLRTIHELLEADAAQVIDAIVLNGRVRSVDTATGRDVEACILSVQVAKKEFLTLDLARVDAKACFKKLKGVGSSVLHSLTAVAPIMRLERNDPRFVASYEVAKGLNEGVNLASMDWEDFEHLVRELLQSEFGAGGGEVRVTRASRDGGVDAVVFDPDPVRGGKIVVQAKRYAHTVGVSAVRDLYGTVMNEGAMKGILVTTSDYGPDAYEFVSDKPLTLLSGSNLLHLLQKYGRKAHIDLVAARRALKDGA